MSVTIITNHYSKALNWFTGYQNQRSSFWTARTSLHYSGTQHPGQYTATYVNTYRRVTQSHPPKHCSDLQPRPIPSLTAPHWDKREAWQHWYWQHAQRSTKSCKPNEAAQSLQLSVQRMKKEKQGWPSKSVLTVIFYAWGTMLEFSLEEIYIILFKTQ